MVEQMRRDEAKHLREEENSRSLAEAEQELHDREAVVKVVADAIKAGDLHDTITRYKIISGAIGVRGVRNKIADSWAWKTQCWPCPLVQSLWLAHGGGRCEGDCDDRWYAYDLAFDDVQRSQRSGVPRR